MRGVRSLLSALLALGLALGMLADATSAADRNLAVVATKAQPSTEPRIALVIGNADYPGAMLGNPVNDARAIADRLGTLRFRVTRLENATQEQMYEAIRAFGDQLRDGGVGLFYYAGHALQVRGRNYLLPVRTRIEREDEIIYRTVDTGQVLAKMESARNRVNIVILDACRNNPFARDFRSVAPGLAVIDAPFNTLIAFATAPGAVASDGDGSNGLYTQHLLQSMSEPGLGLEDLFKKVRSGVRRDSAGRQVPWESTSLEVDFFFDLPGPQTAVQASVAPTPTPLALEMSFWESVKGSTDPDDYRAYLQRYPNGQFAVLAGNRLRALAAAANVPPAGAAPPAIAAAPPAAAPARPAAAPAPVLPPVALAPAAPVALTPPMTTPLTAPSTVPANLTAPTAAPLSTVTSPAPARPPTTSTPAPAPAPQVVASALPALPAMPPAPATTTESMTRPARAAARPLTGHTDQVLAVAVSRNGQLALTGSADRSLRLWDLNTGRELRRLAAGAAGVTATAIAANGRQFLSGGADHMVRLWDAISGTEVVRLDGHKAAVSAVLFGPTARYAVSAARDGEVIVWELPSGRVIRRAMASPGGVGSLALSADGRYLLTAADDALVRLWDVGSLAALRSFGPMAAPAAALAFADGASRVVAVDARGELWAWQAGSGALERRLATSAQPLAQGTLDADGTTALLAAPSGELVLWDIASGRALWRGNAPGARITALGLSPRATLGLAAADDKRLLLWALER